MVQFLNNNKKNIMDMYRADIISNTNFYHMFASRHSSWSDELVPDIEIDTIQDSSIFLKREMMFGKRIHEIDIAYVINKNTWGANTKYVQYDHRENLTDTEYFIINSNDDVFKCLYNNSNNYSTIEPTSKSNTVFQLADSYIWKYMYTVNSANNTKFTTSEYIPIDANTVIENGAANGSIDIILIDSGGENYTVYNTGTVQNSVNTTVFQIDTLAATSNNFYINSGFYISSGTSTGNLAIVDGYVSNATGKFITTNAPLTLDQTSEYIISPQIKIDGDGNGATAYSTINATSDSIESVVILTEGVDYSYTNISAVSNTSYGSGAAFSGIIPPTGGHGSNPIQELKCQDLMIVTDFSNTENSSISTDISFGTVGMIKNPTQFGSNTLIFANTFSAISTLTTSSISGSFINNEKITGLTSNATSNVAFSNNTILDYTIETGNFSNGEIIIGSNSSATATITNINNTEVNRFSGDILYYDNVLALQRSNTAIETVKLIIKF